MTLIGLTDGSQLQCIQPNDSGGLTEIACTIHDKPAITGSDADVLLLDTSADTIAIRSVPGPRRSLSGWRAQRAIIAQSRRLDAGAEVDLLSLDDGRPAVVILNRQVPDEWLSAVSDESKARFRQVLSATRAVARYGPQGDACCLYVVRRGRRVRHLLCRDRVACFTREVVCEDAEAALAALDETLEYLSARDTLTDNTLLAHGALLAEEQDHLLKHPAFADQLLLTSEVADSAVQDVFTATAVHGIAAALSDRSKRWRFGVRDRGLSPRDPWLADRRAHRRLHQYRYAVGVAALLVLLTTGATVLQVANVWQRWQQQEAEKTRLAAAVVVLQKAARDLHPRPAQAASLLEARHRLSASTRADSLWIPAFVASVLTRYDAIALQQVSWHASGLARFSDDAVDQAQWLVRARDSVPMADSPTIQWQVLVSGQLDLRLSLREQQSQFDAFIKDLRQQPNVLQVNIGLSPVEAWRFSPAPVSSSGLPDASIAVGVTGDDALAQQRDKIAANALVFELSMQIASSEHD